MTIDTSVSYLQSTLVDIIMHHIYITDECLCKNAIAINDSLPRNYSIYHSHAIVLYSLRIITPYIHYNGQDFHSSVLLYEYPNSLFHTIQIEIWNYFQECKIVQTGLDDLNKDVLMCYSNQLQYNKKEYSDEYPN